MRPVRIEHRYWIIVPCFNEEKLIEGLVDAIAAQTDTDFVLLLVDNASRDDTRIIAEARIASHPHLTGLVIAEPAKGTGCAADTGFRYAMGHGAEIVFRTDADCVPTRTWFAEMKRTMEERQLDAAGGKVRIRTDDVKLKPRHLVLSRVGAVLVPLVAPFISTNRGDGYKGRYVLMPGPNTAIRTKPYRDSGGYPRTSFDGEYLDKAIANRLRRTTPNLGHARRAVVRASERRTHAYGARGTIAWMLKREAATSATDIR